MRLTSEVLINTSIVFEGGIFISPLIFLIAVIIFEQIPFLFQMKDLFYFHGQPGIRKLKYFPGFSFFDEVPEFSVTKGMNGMNNFKQVFKIRKCP